MALFYGALCMIAAPLMLDATSNSKLNHYSDYGVVEQNQSVTSSGISISNDPYGYSAQYTDSESGLQYLQVRYYDPAIMRFTQMDTYPLLNRYAYANENPIMNDDPNGHSAVGTSNSQFSGAGLAGKLASTGLGLLGGSVTGVILAAGLAVTGGPVTTLVAAMIATAEGAAASAAQTSISAAINHKKLSAGNVLESAGIGAGMALGADLIGEGVGYATGKGIENLTSTSSEDGERQLLTPTNRHSSSYATDSPIKITLDALNGNLDKIPSISATEEPYTALGDRGYSISKENFKPMQAINNMMYKGQDLPEGMHGKLLKWVFTNDGDETSNTSTYIFSNGSGEGKELLGKIEVSGESIKYTTSLKMLEDGFRGLSFQAQAGV